MRFEFGGHLKKVGKKKPAHRRCPMSDSAQAAQVTRLNRPLVAKDTPAGADEVARAGRCSPLGATVMPGGVNFSIFSRSASGAELVFFDREDDARPARVITIDVAINRTENYWHVFV